MPWLPQAARHTRCPGHLAATASHVNAFGTWEESHQPRAPPAAVGFERITPRMNNVGGLLPMTLRGRVWAVHPRCRYCSRGRV